MTITPQIAISEIIGKKEDDVGRRLSLQSSCEQK
jgi:hypothetical protein